MRSHPPAPPPSPPALTRSHPTTSPPVAWLLPAVAAAAAAATRLAARPPGPPGRPAWQPPPPLLPPVLRSDGDLTAAGGRRACSWPRQRRPPRRLQRQRQRHAGAAAVEVASDTRSDSGGGVPRFPTPPSRCEHGGRLRGGGPAAVVAALRYHCTHRRLQPLSAALSNKPGKEAGRRVAAGRKGGGGGGWGDGRGGGNTHAAAPPPPAAAKQWRQRPAGTPPGHARAASLLGSRRRAPPPSATARWGGGGGAPPAPFSPPPPQRGTTPAPPPLPRRVPRRGGTCRGLWVTATGMAAAATEGRPPAVWPPTPWRVWLPSWPPVAGTGVRTGPPAPPLPGVARCVGAQSVAAGRRRRAARRPAISTDGRAGPARRAGARAVHLLTAHPVFVGVGKGGDGTDPRLGWEEEGEAILAVGRDMSRLRRGRHEQQLGLE